MNNKTLMSFSNAVSAMASRHFPDFDTGKVILRVPGGRIIVNISANGPPPEVVPLNAMQKAIMQVLTETQSAEAITGNELSEKAGYQGTGGSWGRSIADLMYRGLITNERPGYRLATPSTNGTH